MKHLPKRPESLCRSRLAVRRTTRNVRSCEITIEHLNILQKPTVEFRSPFPTIRVLNDRDKPTFSHEMFETLEITKSQHHLPSATAGDLIAFFKQSRTVVWPPGNDQLHALTQHTIRTSYLIHCFAETFAKPMALSFVPYAPIENHLDGRKHASWNSTLSSPFPTTDRDNPLRMYIPFCTKADAFTHTQARHHSAGTTFPNGISHIRCQKRL